MKKSRYEMWIDPDLKNRAQTFAKEKGISLAECIEAALQEYLNKKNHEKMMQASMAVDSLTPGQQAKIVRNITKTESPKNKEVLADNCYWCLMGIPNIEKYLNSII